MQVIARMSSAGTRGGNAGHRNAGRRNAGRRNAGHRKDVKRRVLEAVI